MAYGVTGTALGLRGVPYRNGGADPSSGFDCSGFVNYVFGRNGIPVPRTVGELYGTGKAVRGAIEPGDLVFFSTIAPGASHVGIAIGGDEFVHAPSTSGDVRVERLGASYWSTRFVGARRVF
jgi:peptidoglycan DL-endopeptidase CwlO